jgi:hypothetical protein
MQRRDFFKVSGVNAMALGVLKGTAWAIPGPGFEPSPTWNHGSPYLGHSDRRPHFRGLTPQQIQHEIAHFRTSEEWRRIMLFGL